MADPAQPRPLDDLVHAGDTVMLMTMIGNRHSSRPMTAAGVSDATIEFLVDTTAEWTAAVAAGTAIVHVTLSDARRNNFVALNGRAALNRDRAKIDRLWNPGASAFFDGRDDPNVAALRFEVDEGEYWDAPRGRVGALVALVKAAVGGDDAAGDHGPIAAS
jgi:general stress protein 26